MIRIPGKIPITIHPFFWITAAIIGFLISGSFIGTLIWIFVILVSILIHELGHASTAIAFGLKPQIELVALGGLTYHKGEGLPFWKQFFIVLNGPIFGFILFLLAWALLKLTGPTGTVRYILTIFYRINLIWTILNLVPVLPLDGGQLLRILFEAFFGAKGLKYSLIIGMIVAGACSLFFFLFQSFLVGALFFLFAFQSWDMYRRMRHLSEKDRKDIFKNALEEAERNLQEGQKAKAKLAFEKIRGEAKEGIIYMMATQYLAFLLYEEGKIQEAYNLLLPMRSELSPEALCLLHKMAFEQKNYALVEEIGGECFQINPSKEVALRNALSCAFLSKAKPTVGWLETAFQEGLDNISEILKGSEFDAIRETTYFKQFAKHHV